MTGRYTDGLSYDTDFNQDGVNYDTDFDLKAYNASEIGSVIGNATLTDGVQPYVGVGWRSSHKVGLALFSELGLVATDTDVSLRTSSNQESVDPVLQQDIRAEEQKLKDDIEKLPVFPVAVLGITYTF